MTTTAAPVSSRGARPARQIRKLAGLDGLRGLAVIAVIVFHLRSSWLPGGYLGVDIFFVISGYLITALLLSEWAVSSTISLRAFWSRRARRLLPALGTLLLGVTVVAAVFARDSLGRLQSDLPASLFYVMNWRLVFAHQSYVESFGRPPLLQHLWSLSVEEQFYLLWPLALMFLRRRMNRQRVAMVAVGAAAVSAALMAGFYHSGGDPSAVYFDSFTHAQGLLIGCALAAAIPPWQMAPSVTPTARRFLERSGSAALLIVVVGLATFGFRSAVTYRGGMVLLDLATAVAIATAAHPASRLGGLLDRQPLRWAGLRSYSLYLWHWPIFELTRPGVDISWPGWALFPVRIGLTVVAAELSFRYVEQPWRNGHALFALRLRFARWSKRATVATAAVPLAAISVLLATAPGLNEPAILAEGATPAALRTPGPPPPVTASTAATAAAHRSLSPGLDPTGGNRSHPKAAPTTAPAPPTTTASPTTTPPTTTPAPPPTTVPPPVPAADEPVLAIGDSVLLAASPDLSAALGPAITIDAAVGRQVTTGLQRLAHYRSTGALAHYRTVLVDLGTNGAFRPQDFAEMAQLVAGVAHVVVYNVHANRSWAAVTDATIAAGVAAHPGQMTLADWNQAASAPNLLYPDGIHPNTAGAHVYAQLLASALASTGGH